MLSQDETILLLVCSLALLIVMIDYVRSYRKR